MQYMNPLVPEDLTTLNELAKLTWSWNVQYWPEKGLEHGSFWINFTNPHNKTIYRVDGFTIAEAANKAISQINNYILMDSQIPDYP